MSSFNNYVWLCEFSASILRHVPAVLSLASNQKGILVYSDLKTRWAELIGFTSDLLEEFTISV